MRGAFLVSWDPLFAVTLEVGKNLRGNEPKPLSDADGRDLSSVEEQVNLAPRDAEVGRRFVDREQRV